MAISVVGTAQAEDDCAAETALVLTLPASLENDVAFIVAARTDNRALATSSSGWTETLYNTLGASGLNVGVWRKRMGASPDANFTLSAPTAGSGFGRGAVCVVLRGVDTTTMEDAAHTVAGDAANADPNGASITTVTNGAYVWSVGIKNSTNGTAEATVTEPTGYSDKVTAPATAVTLALTAAGAGKIIAVAGAEDPGAWTTWDAGFNWAAVTMAARPQAAAAAGNHINMLLLGVG
jgi:hypothetical protein